MNLESSKQSVVPAPLFVQNAWWNELPPEARVAAEHEANESDFTLRLDRVWCLETYLAVDIAQRLFQERWGWPSYVAMEEEDQERVQDICRILHEGGEPWPYFSYCARDMRQLWGRDQDDGSLRSTFSGAGWHRMVAQSLMGRPTVQLLFCLS